ncbi:MAG: hypothetical protein K2L05_04805 [Muribaculaceae bacterium]|nr:hypothetical protein [Muribaculaceae bacterium]
MKKLSLIAAVAAAMFATSCSSIHFTANTEPVDSKIVSVMSAQMNVASRTSYTLYPTAAQRKAGEKSVKAAAVAALLEKNGNADVLVAPEFEIKRSCGKVKYVKVSGRPATYTNFNPESLQCKGHK